MSKEFKDGYEYANQQLKLGVTPKELEIQIDDSFDFNDFVSGMIARWREIQQLLAQPEPLTPRQGLEEYKKGYARAELDLKREPIDTRRITLEMYSDGIDINYKDGYVDGIRFAEKMHGIGVDDE